MSSAELQEFKVGGLKDRILYPFSRYYRGKKAIASEGLEIQAVLPFVVSSDDGRVIVVKNSKAGCTSLTRAVYFYNNGKDFPGNIHKEGVLHQGYTYWRQNLHLLEAGASFSISSIRNPYDRIRSAFLDFVVEKRNSMRLNHTDVFREFEIDSESNLDTAFDRFLNMVQQSHLSNSWKTDRHWRLQKHNLWTDRISYSLIIRLENFDAGFREVRKALVISEERFPLLRSNKASKKHELRFSAYQKTLIEKIYHEDFEIYESIR